MVHVEALHSHEANLDLEEKDCGWREYVRLMFEQWESEKRRE